MAPRHPLRLGPPFAVALALTLATTAAAVTVKATENVTATVTATVRVGVSSAQGASPPADFAGLSVEPVMVLSSAYGPRFLSPYNSPLVRLLRRVGVASLRVGGGSGDFRPCSATKPGSPPPENPCVGSYVPSSGDVARVAGLVREVGIRSVIFMVSLELMEPGEAAAVAVAAHRLLTSSRSRSSRNSSSSQGVAPAKVYFELGNEENEHWSMDKYATKCRKLMRAVLKSVPEARFSGPDPSSASPNGLPWAARGPAHMGLRASRDYATMHHYPGRSATWKSSCNVRSLLGLDYTAWLGKWRNKVGVPRRISELNSCYGGGKANVSNAFGAALWLLDYLHLMASHGVAGVNLHWGASRTKRGYNPIAPTGPATRYTAYAHMHGMKAFTLLSPTGGGRYYNLKVDQPDGSLRVYVFQLPDGQGMGASLINRHLESAQTVSLDKASAMGIPGASGALGQAQALWLVGDSPSATVSSEYGFAEPDRVTGAPVEGTRRSMNSGPLPTFHAFPDPDKKAFSVSVPAASALLVRWPHAA